MRILFAQREYTIVGTLLTIGALASLWVFDSAFFGVPTLIAYALFFDFLAGNFLLPREHWFWKIFFGSVVLDSAIIIVLSGIYWFYQINDTVISTVLVIIPMIVGLLSYQSAIANQQSFIANRPATSAGRQSPLARQNGSPI